MKLLHCLALITCNLALATGTALSENEDEGAFKIACIGDSITYGEGLQNPDRDSYPAILGSLFGSNCKVRRFGQQGGTVRNFDEQTWQEALQWGPNMVILLFGANDARLDFPSRREAFEEKYQERIFELKDRPERPAIYLCVPPFTKHQEINDVFFRDIDPILQELAKRTDTRTIDLLRPFYQTKGFLYDTVHLSEKGHRMIAEEIYKRITTPGDNNDVKKKSVFDYFKNAWKTKRLY